MGLGETLVLYLTIGLAVSLALLAGAAPASRMARTFEALAAAIFWPLYLPLVLSARSAGSLADASQPRPRAKASPAAQDEMATAIAQVERELAAAFASLDGWAENVLSRERDRLAELAAALGAQAARIREMDALARATGGERDEAPLDAAEASGEALERFRQSQAARCQNIARLAEVRRAAYADLMATLAWIRELVSMIHLAKFTGAPAARAEELVAQIAAAVEGISFVAWRDDPPPVGREAIAKRSARLESAEAPAA